MVREAYRYDGLVFLPWKFVVETLSPWAFLGLMSFYQKDLRAPLKEPLSPCDVTVCRAGGADIEKLSTLIYNRYCQEENDKDFMNWRIQSKIVDLLQRGHVCFLGKIGEAVVHYNWIFFHWNETIPGRYIHLKKDEALLNDAYTAEPWRGKAIHTVVQHQMLLYLQALGYRRTYTYAYTDNRPSLKTHDRLGWKRIGLMLYVVTQNGNRARFWRICGTLDPFMERHIP